MARGNPVACFLRQSRDIAEGAEHHPELRLHHHHGAESVYKQHYLGNNQKTKRGSLALTTGHSNKLEQSVLGVSLNNHFGKHL